MQNATTTASTGPSSIESGGLAIGLVPASPAASAASPPFEDASFAGVLASLAAPRRPDPPWSDDELAEDVATFSYERALRANAQSTPAGGLVGRPDETGVAGIPKAGSPAQPKPLKNASITIRLSESDSAQLRHRAAEAGLTVSAYLRSCALEVESLRAQVKQTLAEMRNSGLTPCDAETKPRRGVQNAFGRLRGWCQQIGRR